MNTTIANRTNQGISLKSRYLAVVAAGALAASALVTVAPWQTSSAGPVAPSSTARIELVRVQPVHTFYIVATDEARAAILAAANEEAESYDASMVYSTPVVTVLVAGDPATDAFLYESVEAILQSGGNIRIVDSTVERSRP